MSDANRHEMTDEEREMVRRGELPKGFRVRMGGVIVDPDGVAVGCSIGDRLPGFRCELVFGDRKAFVEGEP